LDYGFHVKSSKDETFEKSKSFHRCCSLSKRCRDFETARRYITANILQGQQHALSFEDDHYVEWLGRMESIRYHVSSQLKAITLDFEKLFEIQDQYPLIIDKLFEKKCSYETIASINTFTGFLDKVKVSDPLLWPEIKYTIQQYTKLFIMDVDLKKLKRHLVDTYKQT
jgi:hypothetical protein